MKPYQTLNPAGIVPLMRNKGLKFLRAHQKNQKRGVS